MISSITYLANTISENLIVNSLNEKLHDQYIQTWDEKCSTSVNMKSYPCLKNLIIKEAHI